MKGRSTFSSILKSFSSPEGKKFPREIFLIFFLTVYSTGKGNTVLEKSNTLPEKNKYNTKKAKQ